MAEKIITQKTKLLLQDYDHDKEPLFYWKVSDRFTSGIPDYAGTFYGVSFYVELKDEGEQARRLQQWQLQRAENAGALTLSTDSFDEVKSFFESIRLGVLRPTREFHEFFEPNAQRQIRM